VSQSHIEPENKSTTTTPPGLPRWVKVSGVFVVVLIILFAILHLSGAHGPGSHMTSNDHMDQMMPSAEHTPS
jgi:hypothetical protein